MAELLESPDIQTCKSCGGEVCPHCGACLEFQLCAVDCPGPLEPAE